MNYNFVVIEGNIGAGKTSLSKKIAEDYNAKLIPEKFAENPFLPKFYKNPNKYSFPLELSFLADRFYQLNNQISNRDLFKSFVVADYYFTKSLIFAKSTLTDDEFGLYRRIFNIIYTSLPKPDIYVYLYLDINHLIKNIKRRGRDYEKQIKASYLEKIQNGYFEYMKQHREEYKFLVIDTNNIDFVRNQKDYIKIKNIIFNREYKIGINRVIL
ncbi:MAG: deoxynucleoside kinase [Bacteroidales bacterium]|nr:deoxynucleoside kinase [Bacteroidales bacterium]